MTVTITDIANQALDACRARATVTSINPSDGTLAGDVISRQFWPRIDALARSALWNTHRFQTSLTLLRAMQGTDENVNGTSYGNPPTPWLYEYALPTGAAFSVTVPAAATGATTKSVSVPSAPLFLRGRYISPQSTTTAGNPPVMTGGGILSPLPVGWFPSIPYLISSDIDAQATPAQIKVALTNAQNAQLVYTARVTDPTLWDPSFTNAAVATLAAWIEQPLTGANQLLQGLVQIAQAEIMSARISDGDEGTSMVDNVPDWMSARNFNTSQSLAAVGRLWDAIAFPGGVAF